MNLPNLPRRSFLAWLPVFLGGAAAVPMLKDRVTITQLGGATQSHQRCLLPVSEREIRLLERMAKVFAMLSDAQYAIADGDLDKAQWLLWDLGDDAVLESVVIAGPCVVGRRDL